MRLLIVDGSNAIMRAAWGGEHSPADSTPVATRMIEKAIQACEATHLVIAMDCPGVPTWRKEFYPEYKANRTKDTAAWLTAAWAEWSRIGWYVENQSGFEADDVIATVAHHFKATAEEIFVYSSDSDLWPLTEFGVKILKPLSGGQVATMGADEVCRARNVTTPGLLVDLKAMTGDPGDNIFGAPGIGEKRGAALLQTYGGIEGILAAGRNGEGKYESIVAQHEPAVRKALKLVTLSKDVPTPIIPPEACKL